MKWHCWVLTLCKFLLVFHYTILYYFRDIWRWRISWPWNLAWGHSPCEFMSDLYTADRGFLFAAIVCGHSAWPKVSARHTETTQLHRTLIKRMTYFYRPNGIKTPFIWWYIVVCMKLRHVWRNFRASEQTMFVGIWVDFALLLVVSLEIWLFFYF